jgi:hypothetical protein
MHLLRNKTYEHVEIKKEFTYFLFQINITKYSYFYFRINHLQKR